MKVLILLILSFVLTGCDTNAPSAELLSNPCIEPDSEYQYTTCADIEFRVDGNYFLVPEGFSTDLASIPRILWSIASPAKSEFIGPAIVHDFLYRKTCDFDRLNTDRIFFTMLKENGVPVLMAYAMYASVRIFGWRYYNYEYCE